MAEEISKIVVGGKGFEGVIAKFNINCVLDIKIAPTDVDWVSFYVDTNTIHMVVDSWDGEESRSTSFTISFTAETNSNGGTTACTKDFEVEQLSKKFNPDTGSTDCDYFIVDGGSWDDVPAGGASACDSALIYYEGIAKFDPESGADWIHPHFYHWNDGVTPHTYQYFCSIYSDSPCVAESLLRHAGLSPSTKYPKCETGTATLSDFQNDTNGYKVVYEAIMGTSSDPRLNQALGTVWYDIDRNTGNDPRSCTIKWFVNNVECESVEYHITQLGNGGGGGGCDVELSFTNMEGKTAKIYWDAISTTFEEVSGNGPHRHTYATGTEHYFKVKADGYQTYNGKFTCGGQETIQITMEEEGGSCNTCEDLGVTDVNPKTDIPATGFTTNAIGHFTVSCEYDTDNFTVNATGDLQPTGMFVVKTSSNPIVYAVIGTVGATASERTAAVTVLLKGETSPCVTLNIKQVAPSCDCIEEISGRYVNADGGLSIVGQYTSPCKIGSAGSLIYAFGDRVLDLTQPVTFDDNGSDKVISATVVPNETTSEKIGTYVVKVGDTTCDKRIAVVVRPQGTGCKFPSKTIQIFLKMTTQNYENYIITNNVIGNACHDWVLNEGHKYDGYSVENAGVSLAYYDYRGCTVDDYGIGGKYCKIASPGSTSCNGSNETLVQGETYKLYGLNSLGYEYLLDIKMPTDEEAQAAAQDVGGGRIIMYLPNV
jgi:hypothetical protein